MRKLNATEEDPFVEVNFSPLVPKYPSHDNFRNSTEALNAFPVFDFEKKVYMPTFSIPADKVSTF